MIRMYEQKDLQHVIAAHIRIYRDEYNYDEGFAAFVKNAVQQFGHAGDLEHEMLWVVELDGRHAGSIGLVRADEHTAQLRWFLLEPGARGQGWGRKLLEQAIRFAEERSYGRIVLWTNEALTDARRLYSSFGFEIVEGQTQHLSGQNVNEEKWALRLDRQREGAL